MFYIMSFKSDYKSRSRTFDTEITGSLLQQNKL